MFSCVLISKNEKNTLHKCDQSLKEFKSRGGEVVLVDTGSTDGTPELARSFGWKVEEVGEKFIKVIDEELANKINERFIVDGEEPIVKAGNRLFDFASARNYVTSLASNDMICTLDCDEAYTKLDIDKINELIKEGVENFCYQFVFSHDQWGNPAMQFVQSKMFDRRKMKWFGLVHETLQGNVQTKYIGEEIIKLEHWQEQGKDHRGNYLVGLALDCLENQDKDRNSHYFAREMLWFNRPKSAIKEFERHIAMDKWHAEKAQSMIFIGDCYGKLGQMDKQIEYYTKAFHTDPERREALIRLAELHRFHGKHRAVVAFTKAAMEIPWTDYYANDKAMYEHYPHELLYRAYGWLGDIPKAREHILKALEFQPHNPIYLHDTKFYFEYGANNIQGWMTFPEQKFLYELGKQYHLIAELGSWKGRSTHALASGMGDKGEIIAIDTFQGSQEEGDKTNSIAKVEDILATFKENTKQFKNIIVNQGKGLDLVGMYVDKGLEAVFIDAGHTYEEVKADIEAYLPKAKFLICGHDYFPGVWDGVVKAVDEKFGKPDGVVGTIWYKYLVPKVSIVIPHLGRTEGLKRCLESIKNLNYPKEMIETIIVEGEGTVPEKVARGVAKATGEWIVYAANDMTFSPNCIFEAVQSDKSLVAFNGGPVSADEGNICEHFAIRKDFIRKLDGGVFSCEFHHCGADNFLWAQAKKLKEAEWCEGAIVTHEHFSKGAEYDEVYQKGWSKVEEDRALLKKKLKALYE